MIDVFEKLTNVVLKKWEKVSINTFNYILWICLITISYNKCICNSSDFKNLNTFICNGDFVMLIAWAICIIIFYNFLRVFILYFTTVNSSIKQAITKLLPKEYQVPTVNKYYQQAIKMYEVYLPKLSELRRKENTKIIESDRALNVFAGIILKLIILLCVVLKSHSGIELFILLIALALCIVVLLLVLAALSSIKSKENLFAFLQSFVEV